MTAPTTAEVTGAAIKPRRLTISHPWRCPCGDRKKYPNALCDGCSRFTHATERLAVRAKLQKEQDDAQS